ncbi:factor for adipocyte differentiation, putative, partial [Perkinsus marinus ATCC 50983]
IRGVNLAGNGGPWSPYVAGFAAGVPSPCTQLHLVDADCYRGANITNRCNTLDFDIPPNTNAANTTTCNKLAWQPSEDEGGCGLVAYQVFREGSLIAEVPGSNIHFSDLDASLVCGQEYNYAIRALNCRGDESSPLVNVTVRQGARPLPLCRDFVESAEGWVCDGNGLSAKPASTTSLNYSWPRLGSAVSLREDWQSGFAVNESILGYILSHDDGLMGNMEVVYDGVGWPSQTFYIQKNLTPGLTYRATVRAVTTVGQGEASPVLYTVMAEPPDPPMNVKIKWATPTGGVDLYWTAPTYTGHSPVTSYIIQYRSVGESSEFFTIPRYPSGVEQGPYRLDESDNLTRSQEFEFRMASVNTAGQSQWSEVASIWVGNRPLPLPERLGLWFSMVNKTHVGVSWPQLDDESLLMIPDIYGTRRDAWGYVLYAYAFTGNYTPSEAYRTAASANVTSTIIAVPTEATCGGLFCITLRLWTLVGDGTDNPDWRACTDTSDLPGTPIDPR